MSKYQYEKTVKMDMYCSSLNHMSQTAIATRTCNFSEMGLLMMILSARISALRPCERNSSQARG